MHIRFLFIVMLDNYWLGSTSSSSQGLGFVVIAAQIAYFVGNACLDPTTA